MTRILVTGATGFLGRHVIDSLIGAETAPACREATIRVLTRGPSPWSGHSRVEESRGDITDREAVRRAVGGVDAVLHLAGIVRRNPAHAGLMHRTHVDGTRNICDAARAEGARRVVVASTSGTIAVSRTPKVHDESAPYAVEVTQNWPYYRSKIEQERLALSYQDDRGPDIVVLNPSILLGPGDVHHSSTDDVRRFLAGRIPNVPSGGFNFVDARDAALAFASAIGKGRPGARYLVGGHNVTVREFFGLVERASGVPAPRLVLPEWAARAGAGILRGAMKLAGRDFPVDDVSIEMAYRFWYCENALARRELGLRARPASETIRDTIRFIRSEEER